MGDSVVYSVVCHLNLTHYISHARTLIDEYLADTRLTGFVRMIFSYLN